MSSKIAIIKKKKKKERKKIKMTKHSEKEELTSSNDCLKNKRISELITDFRSKNVRMTKRRARRNAVMSLNPKTVAHGSPTFPSSAIIDLTNSEGTILQIRQKRNSKIS